MMTVPASASASGKRHPVYGATEQEVLRNYILQVEFRKGEKVPILEEYLFSYLKTFVLGVKEDTTYDRYYGCCKNQIQGTGLGKMRLNRDVPMADHTEGVAISDVSEVMGFSPALPLHIM